MEEEEYRNNGSSAFHVEMWEDSHQRIIRPHIEWASTDDVPLRIGICGAHGVGKARLARRLGEQLDLPVISHIPRTVKNLGLELNKGADIYTQLAIWLAQVGEQVELYEFIADRTIVETLAYATLMVEESEDEMDAYLVNALTNLSMAMFNGQYTIVLYLPPTGELIKNNGFRNRDKQYQEAIDDKILYFLSAFDSDYFPLSGDETAQYKLALEYLNDSGLLDLEQ